MSLKNKRYKVLTVNEEAIIELLTLRANGTILVSKFKDIPPDATIEMAAWDFCTKAFCFYVGHPSFPEVDIASVSPKVEVRIESIKLTESQQRKAFEFLGRP